MKNPIRVLIVEDEKVLRKFLPKIIETEPSIKVIGAASNGIEAIEMTKRLKPDVITMDILMPEMDGVEALRVIMKENPTPVIMLSAKTFDGAKDTLEALSLGAFDYLAKPVIHGYFDLHNIRQTLVDKIRAASVVPLESLLHAFSLPGPQEKQTQKPSAATLKMGNIKLVGIVASTGGPVAITKILQSLPRQFPLPICIVQHISTEYVSIFLERLNQQSELCVKTAEDDELLKPGHVYFSPGKKHLVVKKQGSQLIAKLNEKPSMASFIPNGNELFWSMGSNLAMKEACGIILTGMGDDGAWGMRRIKDAGGYTIAQGEKTCVVPSMPQRACDVGGVDDVLELEDIIIRLNYLGSVAAGNA